MHDLNQIAGSSVSRDPVGRSKCCVCARVRVFAPFHSLHLHLQIFNARAMRAGVEERDGGGVCGLSPEDRQVDRHPPRARARSL